MQYVFHVRPWYLEFFLFLENELLSKDDTAQIIFLMMNKSCYNDLNNEKRVVHYLPEELEELREVNASEIEDWENRMVQEFGFGFSLLYEMERFKPSSDKAPKFISSHVQWFINNIPKDSTLISLSCDHFVYLLSSYINRLKGGRNHLVQPVGFPKYAQVILNSPFELYPFRKDGLDEKYLDEYFDSLNEKPEDSIHYMKPRKNIPLFMSFKKRLLSIPSPPKKSIFSYLEENKKNIIPARFKQKKKIPYQLDYLQIGGIQLLKKEHKVFYFPLQFEPEMSILAYSPYFKDQQEIIRLICQSLNEGDVLLLKEQPNMVGRRSRLFYKKSTEYHQVKWADPALNSREIILNSTKVISITGTATIEAACLGINSMVFGYPPFRNMLIEKPVSSSGLLHLREILYREYDRNEIIKKVRNEWEEYSKSILFGNYALQSRRSNLTIPNSKELAKDLAEEVLSS